MLQADLCQRESALSSTLQTENQRQIFLCAQIMSFMRKDRVLEDRVGEIKVKGDVGQALHSENIFFFLRKRQKLCTNKDLTRISFLRSVEW